MTVADINTEEACQIAVSQAMKHLRPDNKTEILNAEDKFPEATRADVRALLFLFLYVIGAASCNRISSCKQSRGWSGSNIARRK